MLLARGILAVLKILTPARAESSQDLDLKKRLSRFLDRDCMRCYGVHRNVSMKLGKAKMGDLEEVCLRSRPLNGASAVEINYSIRAYSFHGPDGYSRSARIGSVRAACHAGVKQAPMEIITISSDATIKTAGLRGFT